MLKWIRQFWKVDSHIKYFIINWVLYGLLIIISTIYVYARLDYVRSGLPKQQKQITDSKKEKI